MLLGDFEDIVDSRFVVIQIGVHSNTDVIHIDSYCHSKGFVFEDDVVVNVAHHSLKCRRGISEAKVHDSWFEKSILHLESCLLFITFLYMYIVVTPSDIELHVDVCIAQVANEVWYEQERVLVTHSDGINLPVILDWS